MFYLQQDRLNLEEKPARKPRKATASKIKATAKHLVYPEVDLTRESCRQQLKYILRKGKGRIGFIEWDRSRIVGNEVHLMLDTAERYFGLKRYENVFHICSVILEEMTAALQYADDSNGSIGSNIERAINMLNELAIVSLPENTRTIFFNYCLKAFKKGVFDGWDWHLGILEVATKLVKDETEGKKVLALLDKAELSEYEVEEGYVIRLGVIRKVSGDKEADKFLEQHIHLYPSFRNLAIEEAIRDKEYNKAAGLANDGIALAKKNNDHDLGWYNYLLQIAQEQGDDAKIIENARYLFLNKYNDNLPYFDILKTYVRKEKWQDFVGQLVKDTGKHQHYGIETMAYIFTSEKQWEKLLELLAKNSSFANIKKYEKLLQQDYSAELADLYGNEIWNYMKTKTGRGYYIEVCRYLRRMIKLGQRKKAEVLMDRLWKEYPQRRTLMEELRLV
jgi:hypothetical protein